MADFYIRGSWEIQSTDELASRVLDSHCKVNPHAQETKFLVFTVVKWEWEHFIKCESESNAHYKQCWLVLVVHVGPI